MALSTSLGRLAIVGANTTTPRVYWDGQEITGIQVIRVLSDEDDQRVRIRVAGSQDALYDEMRAEGIIVRKVGA